MRFFRNKIGIFFALFFISAFSSFSQQIIIKGKIMDAVSHDPIPFASLAFKNTTVGKNSDFDGLFSFQFSKLPADSLLVTCIGFTNKSIFVSKDSTSQYIKIYLKPSEISLHEVKVYAGENPAFAIIRKAVASKSEHNYKKIDGYDYNSYNKIEVDINNLDRRLQEKKLTKKINRAIEKVGQLTDDEGEVLLPTFISESISHYYHRNNPKLSKEIIEKTNIKGIGVTDGSLASQFIGSTFQQYDFFDNQVNVLNKDFASPLANDWKLVYDYFLNDSTYFDGHLCYKIDFEPRRKQDLAFTGSLWIDKNSWALAQIDATITKDANMNFIERLKIQQELAPIGNAWFPVKNRILIDVAELTRGTAGMLLKFTNYNDNINVNNEKDTKFFDKGIEISADYSESNPNFWLKIRPESFTEQEQIAYAMIDSIKNIQSVKTLTSLSQILSSGYKPIFKGIEFGSFAFLGAVNNIEGLRVRPGIRTNYAFSKKWVLEGYIGYGFKDQKWKYGGEIRKIFSRKPWTTLTIRCSRDIEQVGLTSDNLQMMPIYTSYLKFGTLNRPYLEDERLLVFQREISKGIIAKIGIKTKTFDPLYNFSYLEKPELEGRSPVLNRYNTTELNTEIKFQRDELAFENENERFSLGAVKSPTITIRYTLGLKNVMQGSFNYHKFLLKYSHTLNLGLLGKTYYRAEAGAILGTVPYPFLKSHLGNSSPFLIFSAFNLMNNFEFMSDKYLMARYFHDFEGLFFNNLPLIKKWKWRSFTTGKFLIGDLSNKNKLMNPTISDISNGKFLSLGGKPYIEMGYGISNIFKIIRVEAIHRLTMLNGPNVHKFGVKFAAEISL